MISADVNTISDIFADLGVSAGWLLRAGTILRNLLLLCAWESTILRNLLVEDQLSDSFNAEVMFLTETWLDSSIADSELFGASFNVFRRDRRFDAVDDS
ncbi:hypothetical protein QE152_g32614 [Popillia japonica]|uniref:Uncharacterized protein n=1 Tax=Popillia japonica TaxID=7064 RepID=A0AAW1IZ07_POPJA